MLPLMSRRALARALVAAGAALALPGAARAAAARGGAMAFRAERAGAAIGSHRLRFTTAGDRLLVDIEIDLEVSFAFITLYRYRHRSRETWQGARLVGLDTTTDDDGERFAVRAAAEGDRLVVETAAGEVVALPGATLPTSYWHERTIAVGQWLDTQTGRLRRARVERVGEEWILAAGERVRATRYRLEGDLRCELWYAGWRWSKLRFAASDGSTIDYVLVSSAFDGAAWATPPRRS